MEQTFCPGCENPCPLEALSPDGISKIVNLLKKHLQAWQLEQKA